MAKFIHHHDRATIEKVYEFGLILSVADLMPPNPLDYFEQPWKWEPEYFVWVDAGKPYPPEAYGGDEEKWEAFVAAADAVSTGAVQ